MESLNANENKMMVAGKVTGEKTEVSIKSRCRKWTEEEVDLYAAILADSKFGFAVALESLAAKKSSNTDLFKHVKHVMDQALNECNFKEINGKKKFRTNSVMKSYELIDTSIEKLRKKYSNLKSEWRRRCELAKSIGGIDLDKPRWFTILNSVFVSIGVGESTFQSAANMMYTAEQNNSVRYLPDIRCGIDEHVRSNVCDVITTAAVKTSPMEDKVEVGEEMSERWEGNGDNIVEERRLNTNGDVIAVERQNISDVIGNERREHANGDVIGNERREHANGEVIGNERREHANGDVIGNERREHANGGVIGNERREHANGDVFGNERREYASGDVIGNERREHTNGDVFGNERREHANGDVIGNERREHANGDVIGNERREHANGDVIGNERREHANGDVIRKANRTTRPRTFVKINQSHGKRKVESSPLHALCEIAKGMQELAASQLKINKLVVDNDLKRDQMFYRYCSEQAEKNRVHELRLAEIYSSMLSNRSKDIPPVVPFHFPSKMNNLSTPRRRSPLAFEDKRSGYGETTDVTPTRNSEDAERCVSTSEDMSQHNEQV